MSWTVPSGCYYASWLGAVAQWRYYGPGETPTGDQAIEAKIPRFVLFDFQNGYIYTPLQSINITVNNDDTFVCADKETMTSGMYVGIFASNKSLSEKKITITGTPFTFGNGSNMLGRDVFPFSDRLFYAMENTFFNRTDIVSIKIPKGIDFLNYCCFGCTNLQTVTGRLNIYCAPGAFYGCASLETAPTFSGSINTETRKGRYPPNYKSFDHCFYGCLSLETAPTLPDGIEVMNNCFNGCTALETAPNITSSVTEIEGCFKDCALLTGAITIDASPINITDAFLGTINEIVIIGTGGLNETISSEYANVYSWSLTANITAQRTEATPTTVNISVDVSRFNTGTLSSLNLYRDSSSTPLSVTWNDPTLSIDSIPETFTTTLANISESDTLTLTVIATDSYGSSQASSVKIPISFYTMDVQAGGKEIAFGGLADDDVTDYPEGLFKCAMSFRLKDHLFWVGTRSEYEQAVEDDKMPEHTIVFITDETADYVVEEGTSGGWTYRKWNSGVSECWCITSPTSMAVSAWAAWGSVYEAKITDAINYPTNLFTSFPTVIASATPRSTAGVMGIETSATGDASHTPIFYALRPNKPSATMTVSASIHAIGTWK